MLARRAFFWDGRAMLENPSDAEIYDLLATPLRIALVGASLNPARASHSVGNMLAGRGHHVVGVNPCHAGTPLFGQPIVARLEDVPGPVDMVDVFRQSDALPAIVETVITQMPSVKVIWTQLDVVHEEAAARARAAGLMVIQDRCPVIEYRRLF
ncbi:CoA-binding protein [Thalassobacter sp. 16PALIMAR09]|nr:CoA-binding protein [Thalassobacter sp. 16PALIMAR09]